MMASIPPSFIYLAGAALIPLIKSKAMRQIFSLAVALLGVLCIFSLSPQSSWIVDFMGFPIVLLHVDKMSLIVGYIFSVISFFGLLYSLHVEDMRHQLLGLLYIGTSIGAVFAGDLLSLYLYWELMAVASVGLVFLNTETEARKAGVRYLLMHLIGGTVFVGGIFLHYLQTHSLAIEPMPFGLPFYLMLFGVGMNAGFVLLHTWLPDAYPRALFTGSVFMSVYTTKTAVYVLARIAPGVEFVAYMGATMVVFGAAMALVQNNSRKLLAYSIIGQVGYMVASIGLGGRLGLNGAMFHLVNHILYKSLLFMAIGAVIYRTGKENLTDLGGIAKKMPITFAAAVVASLSTSGAPLFNGFASKAIIFQAAASDVTLELLLELGAVGTILAFIRFIYFGFIRQNETANLELVNEAPIHMVIAMACVAIISLTIGIAPNLYVPFLPFELTATEATFYTVPRVAGILQLLVVSCVLFYYGRSFFAPRRVTTYDFDWFYFQLGKAIQAVAEGFSRVNNAIEEATGKIPPALMSLFAPLNKINEAVNRFLFSLFVDMWLFKAITSPISAVFRQDEEDGEPKIGEDESTVTSKLFDQFARIGEYFGEFSAKFDSMVVDGIVNGVASVTCAIARALRPVQTGDVQSYGLIMIGGACCSVLIFLILIFKGVV